MGSIQDTNGSLVLITGATGHLGFKALLDALQAGYRVRAAVRSESKGEVITSNAEYKALSVPEGQLEFVVVPDLAVAEAYDQAVQGVEGIVHIASPITTGGKISAEEYEEYFIKPALTGTIGMLESAAKAPSVKRVIITSSIVAQIDFPTLMQGNSDNVINAESRIPTPTGPYMNEFHAYAASKTASLNKAESWMAERKPQFDLVSIHPAFIEGHDALVKTPEEAMKGTNGVILRVAKGIKAPFALPGNSVHNDDVARLHVEALDRAKIPAGAYLASANTPRNTLDGSRWETINDLIAKYFPEQIKSGVLDNTGFQPSIAHKIDSSKTEKTFGWELQEFGPQVQSVVQMYLDVFGDA